MVHLATMTRAEGDVTSLLRSWKAGDLTAGDALLALVYEELHRIAVRSMRGERQSHTLRPTDLVSEAYLRLARGAQPDWSDRVQFFAIAANTMRRILVDHARKRRADKRGGGVDTIELDDQVAADSNVDILSLDDAIVALARHDERKARTIELTYFGGLLNDEVAAVLDVHVNTVTRDLQFARAWLRRYLAAES